MGRIETIERSVDYQSPECWDYLRLLWRRYYGFNQNWNGARVIISRRESWSEYLDIYDRYVLGQKTDNETAYFEAGDKIKVKIKTKNDEGKDVSRESFF